MSASLAFAAPSLPARYDAMCRAIDAAYEIDEVKDIRDQAIALETYAKQAKNTEAERRACEIRLRAERKAGELLRERDKARAGRPPENRSSDPTDYRGAPTLHDLGISKDQSSQWQRLAGVPPEQFETALSDPIEKPTTAGIIRRADPVRSRVAAVDNDALWLWGRLKDFDRNGLLKLDPDAVLQTMTPEMLDDVHQLAPRVANWLRQIGRVNR